LCCWAVCLSPSVAGLTTEDERPVAFSLIFASGIGIAGLGELTAGHLPGWLREFSRNSHVTSTHATGAALCLACGIATFALVPVSRLTLRSSAPAVRLPRFSNPFLRQFLPAMALWSLVTGSFAPFANVYFVRHLGVSMEKAGTVFSLSNVGQVIAVLAAPLLFRKTGLTRGIMLTQFATAAALGWLAIAHTGMQAAAIYWIYMAVQCMNEPGIYSLLMDRIPSDEHNGASAATFFVAGAAQAIASLAMGPAIVRFGYSSSLVAIAIVAVVAALVFGRLPKERFPAVVAI
jgi:predicted MFS family arabinose efflux permease